jgi:hypothetical protein
LKSEILEKSTATKKEINAEIKELTKVNVLKLFKGNIWTRSGPVDVKLERGQ